MNTDKPVVTGGQITAAVGLLWPAILGVCAAFNLWVPTVDQTAAITGLAGAITAAVSLFTAKVAASRVFIPASAQAMADASHEKAHDEDAARIVTIQAEADERVRIAESFGRPDQNQSPTWPPVGGRQDTHDVIDPEGRRSGRPPHL